MEINRRALYNSLRMNWVLDPTLKVEAWQVEDYRTMPLDVIFEKLEDRKLKLDKTLFLALGETVESPEELTDVLLHDLTLNQKDRDQLYLLVFELWRRLLPEKPTLSILCDELDHQIHLYDSGRNDSFEGLQDTLANLQMVLDENVDGGMKPLKAMEIINDGCANDIESFLHDFISDQIDNGNESYANDLLDGFRNYMVDGKWFDFLKARLHEEEEPEEAARVIKKLIDKKTTKPDLEFNFEVLSFFVRNGDKVTFESLAKRTLDLIQIEEDFQVLLSICADFYHRLDQEKTEMAIQQLMNKRAKLDLDQPFNPKDPQKAEFVNIISNK